MAQEDSVSVARRTRSSRQASRAEAKKSASRKKSNEEKSMSNDCNDIQIQESIVEIVADLLTNWSKSTHDEASLDLLDTKIEAWILNHLSAEDIVLNEDTELSIIAAASIPRFEKTRAAAVNITPLKTCPTLLALSCLDAVRSICCRVAAIKDALSHKEVIRKTLTDDISEPFRSMWQIRVAKLITVPNLHSEEGLKLLAFLTSSLSEETSVLILQAIETEFILNQESRISCLLDSFSKILHNAWLQCIEPGIKILIEQFIEKLIVLSVTYDKPVSLKSVHLLRCFFIKKDNTTRELVCRLAPSVLTEFLHVANWKVRVAAFKIYCRFFPLVDFQLPTREYELEMEKAFEILKKFPLDKHPGVRAAAVSAICSLLDDCWSLFPSDVVVELLAILFQQCARDISSPAVREATIVGISALLKHPIAQEILKEVLPTWKDMIHDSSAAVRLAMANLLIVTSRVSNYHYCSVVPLEQITARFVIDSLKYQLENKDSLKPVCTALAGLLFQSISQESKDPSKQLQVIQILCNELPFVMPQLFEFSRAQLPSVEKLRLAGGLFQLASRQFAISSDSASDASVESQKLGLLFLGLSVSLLTHISFTTPNSKRRKNAAKSDSIEFVQSVQTFFKENFKSSCLEMFVDSISTTSLLQAAIRKKGRQILYFLLTLPCNILDSEIIDKLPLCLQQEEGIGSEDWLDLIQLCTVSSLRPQLIEFMSRWLELLQNLGVTLNSMHGSDINAFPFNDDDIKIALKFVSVLPRTVKMIGLNSDLHEQTLDCLKSIFDLCLMERALRKQGEFCSTIIKSYVALVILTETESKTMCIMNQLLNALSCFDVSTPENVQLLIATLNVGTSVLKDNNNEPDLKSLEWVYCVLASLMACLVSSASPAEKMLDFHLQSDPFEAENEDTNRQAFWSLYGIRNGIVQIMLLLTNSNDKGFWTHYRQFFGRVSKVFECLLKCPFTDKAEFVTSLKLFSAFILVDLIDDDSVQIQNGFLRVRVVGTPNLTGSEDSDDAENRRPSKMRKDSSCPVSSVNRQMARIIHSNLFEFSNLLKKVKLQTGFLACWGTFESNSQISIPRPTHSATNVQILTSAETWQSQLPNFSMKLLSELWKCEKQEDGENLDTDPEVTSIDLSTSLRAIESLQTVTGKTPLKARQSAGVNPQNEE